eukprot:1158365-Pelagomonas_calceolata.AAC.11
MEAALVLSEVLILPLCLLPTACLNPGTDKHWYELGAIKAGHQGSKWPRYSNKFYLPLICFLLNQGMAGMLETYHLLYAFFLLAVGIVRPGSLSSVGGLIDVSENWDLTSLNGLESLMEVSNNSKHMSKSKILDHK